MLSTLHVMGRRLLETLFAGDRCRGDARQRVCAGSDGERHRDVAYQPRMLQLGFRLAL